MVADRLRRLSGSWLLLWLALAGGPAAGDFCEDFAAIVSAGQEGFIELRGEQITRHVDPVTDMRPLWQCRRGLPGADRCEVEWMGQTYTVRLLWLRPTLEANGEAFAAVRELVNGCGATEKQISKSGQSIWFGIEGQEDMDIVLAYNLNRVRLSLSVIGFPDPSLE